MTYDILSTNEIDPSDVFDRLKELHDELCSDSADYVAICRGRSPDKLSEFIDEDSSGRDLLSELDEADLDVDLDELIALVDFFVQLRGEGGGQKLGGLWLPCTLIADNGYFEDYIIDDLESSGICSGLEHVVLDKSATADQHRCDYGTVEIQGTDYLYRA